MEILEGPEASKDSALSVGATRGAARAMAEGTQSRRRAASMNRMRSLVIQGTTRGLVLGGGSPWFNVGRVVKGITHSIHAFIQKTGTVLGAEDRAVDTPTRKEGKSREVKGREGRKVRGGRAEGSRDGGRARNRKE